MYVQPLESGEFVRTPFSILFTNMPILSFNCLANEIYLDYAVYQDLGSILLTEDFHFMASDPQNPPILQDQQLVGTFSFRNGLCRLDHLLPMLLDTNSFTSASLTPFTRF